MINLKDIQIRKVSASDIKYYLLNFHYAKRIPPISYAFAAFSGGTVVGVVTYGKPLSSTLRDGVCGKELSKNVYELNRLWCESVKNLASKLVAASLKMLPDDTIVVSYADAGQQGHVGYVYQATNFVYTGMTAKMNDWAVKGMEHMHHASINDLARGQDDRVAFLKEKFGDRLYMKERSRKHRYVYARGPMRKIMMQELRYPIEPYPKGETKRYEIQEPDTIIDI